ncbi:ribonuclease H-like domain-containing protein [Luteolibacter arcticus]|uniref:Ribonuclease H-like domain-containing protein n=1 Tax=Luteolibacter arcticus TaxID=1581411 RepID=A0ABT3GCF5_9BACT|nr:ribonuclease H-like domain-containing protein [Luteolibacter arcticus]MCW1921292.1 ribonuclease H-like domain-containing protein [Luteolibacter arcticus]
MISNFEDAGTLGPSPQPSAPREPGIVVFDIETGPRPVAELEALMPEFEAPANYKDPAKIAEAIEQKRAAWIEKAALSPLTGRVLAIGALIDGEYLHAIQGDGFDSEAEIIGWFWTMIGNRTILIGHNSNRFDLPFLFRRSWSLGILPPPRSNGRSFAGSIDLMEAWQLGDRTEFISLDTVAKFLGVGAKTGSGGQFADLLKFDVEAALRYLENDVMLTARVAERMGFDAGCPDVATASKEAVPQPASVGDPDDY